MGSGSGTDLVVEVDYGQFYARRAGAAWASDRVTEEGYEQHLWSGGGFVHIGTDRRYGPTRVRVEALDGPPAEPSADWQHVAEVSVDAGGDLELLSWAEGEPEAVVAIGPGTARLRVCWAGLVAGRFEGLDDDGNSDEHLLVQVWPAEPSPPRVLRHWDGWLLPPPTDVSPAGLRQVEYYERMLELIPQLEEVGRLHHTAPLPDGGPHARAYVVYRDLRDGSWWVDGSDVRRTLREVTADEAQRLLEDHTAPS